MSKKSLITGIILGVTLSSILSIGVVTASRSSWHKERLFGKDCIVNAISTAIWCE